MSHSYFKTDNQVDTQNLFLFLLNLPRAHGQLKVCSWPKSTRGRRWRSGVVEAWPECHRRPPGLHKCKKSPFTAVVWTEFDKDPLCGALPTPHFISSISLHWTPDNSRLYSFYFGLLSHVHVSLCLNILISIFPNFALAFQVAIFLSPFLKTINKNNDTKKINTNVISSHFIPFILRCIKVQSSSSVSFLQGHWFVCVDPFCYSSDGEGVATFYIVQGYTHKVSHHLWCSSFKLKFFHILGNTTKHNSLQHIPMTIPEKERTVHSWPKLFLVRHTRLLGLLYLY